MTQDRTRPFHPLDQRPRDENRPTAKPFKDKSRFAPKPKAPKEQLPDDTDVLYGLHSVKEALANPRRRFRRLMATENALQRLVDDGVKLPLEPEVVKPEVIGKRLTADAVHQGLYLEAERLPLLPLDKLPQDRIILALDQVTDPHNVGAILRSAAAFGVGGLIVTHRHSPEITGVLAKAASGALEHVPMAGVQNLARALTSLKEQGFRIIGLDSEAPENIADLKLSLPLVLVLGAEGRGLRPSTGELCDHLARLELPGAIKSLNVSNAAAISLYAVQQATRRA
jgi:23S rRNA (guanosine2251-2'-O)-methyltransferase